MTTQARRDFLKLGGLATGIAAVGAVAGTVLTAQKAAAQAKSDSQLRTVLDRGKLIVGTGSTNPPWHFEDDKGQLTGMDIAMARILAKGLFDDVKKVEFVKQEANQRIPNIATGKVDIVIQFMTVSPARAQLVAFSRPYYVEGAALMTSPKGKWKKYAELKAAGKQVRASVLQNVDADTLVHNALPDAQVLQLDSQANTFQALDAGRADVAVVDASTVKWLAKRNPDKYVDAGYAYEAQLYSAAMRQGDQDWLHWVNTCFDVAMHGHQPEIYTAAFEEFFGEKPPEQKPGFPVI
ncbi:MAG: transporter substrate-binding domain-containing protein [Proteobacteria bacterium]|nr:transporter substrate-binding domain-containing protein [Pseudomonadota bacterium]MBI3499149.1 transporter substrate-binding domain-containing protein [Pseudomonadota bacterium]